MTQDWGGRFTPARDVARIQSAFRAMGHGARGVVVLDGNVSGSRVINVENVHGKVRFVDGRLNLVEARSAARGAASLRYLRLDDLPLGQLPSSVELVRSPGARMQIGGPTSRELSGLTQTVAQPGNEAGRSGSGGWWVG